MNQNTDEPRSLGLLLALNHFHDRGRKHIYAGTVPAHVIRRRRKRNKAAWLSRRINRTR